MKLKEANQRESTLILQPVDDYKQPLRQLEMRIFTHKWKKQRISYSAAITTAKGSHIKNRKYPKLLDLENPILQAQGWHTDCLALVAPVWQYLLTPCPTQHTHTSWYSRPEPSTPLILPLEANHWLPWLWASSMITLPMWLGGRQQQRHISGAAPKLVCPIDSSGTSLSLLQMGHLLLPCVKWEY